MTCPTCLKSKVHITTTLSNDLVSVLGLFFPVPQECLEHGDKFYGYTLAIGDFPIGWVMILVSAAVVAISRL
jgi:hypothetical protein